MYCKKNLTGCSIQQSILGCLIYMISNIYICTWKNKIYNFKDRHILVLKSMVWFHKYWTLFLPSKCNVKENKSSSQPNSRHRLDKK